jgi:hypothetical protein
VFLHTSVYLSTWLWVSLYVVLRCLLFSGTHLVVVAILVCLLRILAGLLVGAAAGSSISSVLSTSISSSMLLAVVQDTDNTTSP